jgi:mono/diheme cytochrome c family protein
MRPIVLATALGLAVCACSAPPPGPAKTSSADAQRGQLLYDTACVECHSTQAHWRDKRLVRDWPGLVHQVTRWQAIAGQAWRREEVEDVAEYLNQRFYKLP